MGTAEAKGATGRPLQRVLSDATPDIVPRYPITLIYVNVITIKIRSASGGSRLIVSSIISLLPALSIAPPIPAAFAEKVLLVTVKVCLGRVHAPTVARDRAAVSG